MSDAKKKTKPANDVELLRAIEEMEVDDDLAELERMTDEEVSAEIRAAGGDPEAIGARGAALAKELIERKKRLRWHEEMEAKLEEFRAKAAQREQRPRLPRAELLAQLTIARKNPKLPAPAMALFQKKTLEKSTDEELQALLDEVEMLAEIADE